MILRVLCGKGFVISLGNASIRKFHKILLASVEIFRTFDFANQLLQRRLGANGALGSGFMLVLGPS